MINLRNWLLLGLVLSSLSQSYALDPNKQPSIIDWSANAGKKILEFSYTDNNTYWQQYQDWFSAPGWDDFKKNTSQSATIKLIKELKLACSVKYINLASITPSFIKPDIWQVKLPAIITYSGKKTATSYPATINFTLRFNEKAKLSPKIEHMYTEITATATSKKIYPRGCHLRKSA